MTIRIGCSGYHYRHWRAAFYPQDLPVRRWFDYYAGRFPTVEINASFYRFPTAQDADRWIAQAPEGFVYSIKAPRLITHCHRLRACDELFSGLVAVLSPLGPRLGRVLFQMPATWTFRMERLDTLLSVLPGGLPCALEFRDPSWWRPEVIEALSGAGHVFVSVHAPGLPSELVDCAGRVYLRLHGVPWYRQDYSDAELEAWAGRLRAPGLREGWVYFNNDAAAAAPRNALRLAELLGVDQTARQYQSDR